MAFLTSSIYPVIMVSNVKNCFQLFTILKDKVADIKDIQYLYFLQGTPLKVKYEFKSTWFYEIQKHREISCAYKRRRL